MVKHQVVNNEVDFDGMVVDSPNDDLDALVALHWRHWLATEDSRYGSAEVNLYVSSNNEDSFMSFVTWNKKDGIEDFANNVDTVFYDWLYAWHWSILTISNTSIVLNLVDIKGNVLEDCSSLVLDFTTCNYMVMFSGSPRSIITTDVRNENI